MQTRSPYLIAIIALFLIIGIYTYLEARKVISGPILTIDNPENGATIDGALVIVSGTAKNVSALALNDRPVTIDEEGRFNESLLLPPGYSIIKLEGADKFGKHASTSLELYRTGNDQPSMPPATTTGTTTADTEIIPR